MLDKMLALSAGDLAPVLQPNYLMRDHRGYTSSLHYTPPFPSLPQVSTGIDSIVNTGLVHQDVFAPPDDSNLMAAPELPLVHVCVFFLAFYPMLMSLFEIYENDEKLAAKKTEVFVVGREIGRGFKNVKKSGDLVADREIWNHYQCLWGRFLRPLCTPLFST